MKTLFILLLSFLCMETFAQQDQQESTLFSADILYNGEVEQQYPQKTPGFALLYGQRIYQWPYCDNLAYIHSEFNY